MKTDVWSDTFLDAMRLVGDPLADAVVHEIFSRGEVGAVNRMMGSLVHNDGVPRSDLPPVVNDFLATTTRLPLHDPEEIRTAERLFARRGPEILVALGFYALPASYAARKGVQVLHRTAYLTKRPMRRVLETTQMVVDVLSPGGMDAGGSGVRTAQKVRLMHAAVRRLLREDPSTPWDPDLGVPINQEDLAGTLMTFSYLVLDGLARLQARVLPAEQEAYQRTWGLVGALMGIDARLIPTSVEQAVELTRRIHERQIAPCPEGQVLMEALLHGYEGLVPLEVLRGVPRALVHYFLDRDPITGQNIRVMLGVGAADWSETFIRAAEGFFHAASESLGVELDPVSLASRRYGLAMVEGMLRLERGGQRPPFSIPSELQALWAGPGLSS